MSTSPFVVVGESLVDIVVAQQGEVSEAVGGSPMNVAVGLARLDVRSLLVTRVGDDERGLRVAEHVRASGAELSPSSVVPGSKTSTATARLDHENAARYEFDLTWELAHQELPDTPGLHIGSLGAALAPGREAVLDLVRQANDRDIFVSYDPNIRPAFLGDERRAWLNVVSLAASSQLVKVSDEDLRLLRPDAALDDLARELLAGERTELVIVTRGGEGSTGFGEGYHVSVAAPRVEVVDTVGAGDSFMAATLAILADWALLDRGPGTLAALGDLRVATLLAGAMSAAAITCARRGANPPRRPELPPTWPVS